MGVIAAILLGGTAVVLGKWGTFIAEHGLDNFIYSFDPKYRGKPRKRRKPDATASTKTASPSCASAATGRSSPPPSKPLTAEAKVEAIKGGLTVPRKEPQYLTLAGLNNEDILGPEDVVPDPFGPPDPAKPKAKK